MYPMCRSRSSNTKPNPHFCPPLDTTRHSSDRLQLYVAPHLIASSFCSTLPSSASTSSSSSSSTSTHIHIHIRIYIRLATSA